MATLMDFDVSLLERWTSTGCSLVLLNWCFKDVCAGCSSRVPGTVGVPSQNAVHTGWILSAKGRGWLDHGWIWAGVEGPGLLEGGRNTEKERWVREARVENRTNQNEKWHKHIKCYSQRDCRRPHLMHTKPRLAVPSSLQLPVCSFPTQVVSTRLTHAPNNWAQACSTRTVSAVIL